MSLAALCRETITVERSADSVDAVGSPQKTWATHLTLLAYVAQRPPSEGREFDKQTVRSNWVFIVPGDKDIEEDDRIVYAGQTFSVRGVSRSGRPGPKTLYTRIDAEDVE